jgi:Icc-related predicted phosphoesterase
MITIDCIADLHGSFPKLPGGDLLIIAGDCSSNDSVKAWHNFYEWADQQNYKKQIMIGGNHDKFLEQSISSKECRELCEIVGEPYEELQPEYLFDTLTEFEGIKIYGTPWTRTFKGINPHCTAFTLENEEQLKEKFDLIPQDTEILISHSPAWSCCDKNKRGHACGSKALYDKILTLKNLKFHIFGHIHEGYGRILLKRPGHGDENNINCLNVSFMNGDYEPVNDYMRIEIPKKKL